MLFFFSLSVPASINSSIEKISIDECNSSPNYFLYKARLLKWVLPAFESCRCGTIQSCDAWKLSSRSVRHAGKKVGNSS